MMLQKCNKSYIFFMENNLGWRDNPNTGIYETVFSNQRVLVPSSPPTVFSARSSQ
jgi:hypothetical protein